MGRLQARKGVDLLIKAFIAADVADARLLIVGPDEGMLPALQALAGGDSRIVFTGYLDGDGQGLARWRRAISSPCPPPARGNR